MVLHVRSTPFRPRLLCLTTALFCHRPTTLTLYDYVRVEEIYVLLFQAKVFLDKKAKKPRERGDPQPFATKLMYGGGGLAGVVAVVWLPLFAFSSANIFQNELNNVVSVEVSFDIQISGQSGAQAFASRYPLFTSQSAQILSSPPDSVLLQVDSAFIPRNFEATFPTAVERETVQQVTVDRDAQTSWSINVPARAALTQALLRNSTQCRCQLTYAFTRGDSGTEPVSTGRTPARIEDGVPLTFAEKLTLYNMITNESLAASTLAIPEVTYPLYLKLGDTATPIENLDPTRVEVELGHNISIGQPYGVETLYEWWSMKAINRTRDENNDGALPCPVERCGVFHGDARADRRGGGRVGVYRHQRQGRRRGRCCDIVAQHGPGWVLHNHRAGDMADAARNVGTDCDRRNVSTKHPPSSLPPVLTRRARCLADTATRTV